MNSLQNFMFILCWSKSTMSIFCILFDFQTTLLFFIFYLFFVCLFVWLVVFNATINNISVISWRSVLLVEETGVPGENHRPVAIMLYISPWPRIELTTSVVIGIACIGKYNYHTITATTLERGVVPVYKNFNKNIIYLKISTDNRRRN